MQLMPNLVHVTHVTVVGHHRLRLRFEAGTEGEIDASGWRWHGAFEPLRDPEYFSQARLDAELGTVVWPNSADVAPETLPAWVAEGRERASA
jgi:hypothetical protein